MKWCKNCLHAEECNNPEYFLCTEGKDIWPVYVHKTNKGCSRHLDNTYFPPKEAFKQMKEGRRYVSFNP